MPVNRKVRPEIMDSVALLVLDAQDAFIDSLHDKNEFLNRCAFAIEAARILRLRTLFTEQSPEKLGRTNATLFKLARNPTVFAKSSFSAFGAPGIERFLREKEIYHLLIVGLETPICVYQTGLQATEEDVDVTFLCDALGARRPQDAALALAALARLGCQCLPAETVFYSLLSDAQSPYFRAFNELVKTFDRPGFSLDDYLSSRSSRTEQEKEETEDEPPSESQQQEEDPDQKRNQNQDRSRDRNRDRDRDRNRDRAQQDRRPVEGTGDPTSQAGLEEQGEKRSRRRNRRRRGRGPREENPGVGRQEADQPSPPVSHTQAEPAPARTSPRVDERRDAERPEPEKPSAPAAQANEPAPEVSPPPAKKAAARKTTRKAAKKTARKAAKKAARKTSSPSRSRDSADSRSADEPRE